jgi:excisionase family DNA binding protein
MEKAITSKDKSERLTLSVAEAAACLGLSRNAAYSAAKNGQIPCIKIGKRLLVPKIQLEKLLKGNGNETSKL